MKINTAIMAAALGISVASCWSPQKGSDTEKQASERTPQTENLLENLKLSATQGYIYGHHDDPMYGVEWVGEEERSDVKSVCGDYPGLMTFDLGHLELGDSVNLDGVPFNKIRLETIRQYERGGIISMSWHLDNPLTGGDSWDVSDSTVVASVLDGGAQHEKFVGWLDKLAAFLNSLTTDQGVKVPVIFRPWHEHSGSWFWWGEKLCTIGQYKALWQLTLDELKEQGVDNVLFAYSPGSESNGDVARYLERYPGDEAIDVLGLDTYCFGNPEDPATIQNYQNTLNTNLATICQLAKVKGKIAALTETGMEGIPVADYWTKLSEVLDKFPIAYAQTWRNAHDKPGHFYAPYPGQVSADDFVKFYENPRTFFVGDLKGLYDETK